MRILITTPTGHIGSRIVDRLLTSGHDLTVLARAPGKLPEPVREGVTVVEGSLEDAAAVDRALAGADAAFFLIPPPAPSVPHWRQWQEATGRTLAAAAAKAHVPRVVFLSSIAAQHDDVGAISGLGAVERILDAALPNVVSLRAGYFMENYFGSLPTIAVPGAVFGVFDGTSKMQIVATSDIGDIAARWLVDDSWTGHHKVGAHGPEPLTQDEVVAILSEVLERPVGYVRIPPPSLRDALLQAGLPPLFAEGYEEMMGGLAPHLASGDYLAEPHNANPSGGVSFRTFAQQALRPAFEAQALASA
ncbi:MAG: NmrA family NAD(P)-binding protein [Gemmatimonadota bacterium]